jgi:methylated-DNA-[protein]-cysteine S-methyltransferase
MVKTMKLETLIGSAAADNPEKVIEELLLRSSAKLDRALQRIRRPEAAVGVVKSKLGDLLVALSSSGIVLNHYVDEISDVAATLSKLRSQFDPVEDQRAVTAVGEEVNRYLTGGVNALRHHSDLALVVNPFQRKVLEKLQAVPFGALISYQGLAGAIGSPSSARAVGNALHNNPVPIYVPCHRVISSDGRIGGYGGGTRRKLQLLRSEGFVLGENAVRVPKNVVRGHRTTQIYCRTSCRAAARAGRGRMFFFADQSAARQAGLRPCKICRPDSELTEKSLQAGLPKVG